RPKYIGNFFEGNMKLYRNQLIVKEVEERLFSRSGRRGRRGTHYIYTRVYTALQKYMDMQPGSNI
ncbi:hypothetical protein, partial [Bacteroides fluxus]|uniref:hypothetical protein n=1 Tax=Bacteroides fluxus TaxID=626930 RepID=UPI0023A7BE1B